MIQPGVFPRHSAVLNSWKEIASYLGRGVRTVQRWEQELGLPVHRPKGKDRSAVLAFREELDQWLRSTAVRSNGNGNGHAVPASASELLALGLQLQTLSERLLASSDRRQRPEAERLVRAVREIVRQLTEMSNGGSATSTSLCKAG